VTTLYMTNDPDLYDEATGTMHPTLQAANEHASTRRKAGIDTQIDKVVLKKLPIKELFCALYNGKDFAGEITPIRVLKGLKKPKAQKPATS
jgi:hypothetical protein